MTDITTLTPAQIAALTPAELAAYSADDLALMTPEQVAAITADQMTALDAEQLAAIAPAIEQWQQLVSSFTAAQSQAAADARAAFVQPLNDVLSSAEFATVKAAIEALGDRYTSESFAPRLRCLVTGLAMTAVS